MNETDAKATAEAIAHLKRWYNDGDVIELRTLHVTDKNGRWPKTWSGYYDYDHFDKLAEDAVRLTRRATGTYITMNPVNPALLARRQNRCKELGKGEPTTSDTDIVRLRRLPIDTDPDRPSGISANDEELQAAIERVTTIRDMLRKRGWPDPEMAMSGNGGHLNYKIDLPPEDSPMIGKVLQVLAMYFDNDLVKVDKTVFNPARIWKLYGTLARKGDNTTDRPHRYAKTLEAPEVMEVVPRDLLLELANELPDEVQDEKRSHSGAQIDVADWLKENSISYREKDWSSKYGLAKRYILSVCPWNSAHTDASAWVAQWESGAIAAGCQHNSCSGKDWKDLRALFGKRESHERAPPTYEEPPMTWDSWDEPPPAPSEPAKIETGPRFDLYSAFDALQPQPDVDWIVENLISPGSVNILVGEPGSKKTYALLDMGVKIGGGKSWLGMPTRKGTVLIIDEESGYRRLSRRLGGVLRGNNADHETPIFYTTLSNLNIRNALDVAHMQKLIEDVEADLVIIDALADVVPGADENSVQDMQPPMIGLRGVAEKTQAAIMVIHHSNKNGNYRGSSAIKGSVDLMLTIESAADESLVQFGFEKARDVEPFKFAGNAHFEDGKFWMTPTVANTPKRSDFTSKSQRYVMRYLDAHGVSTMAEIQNNVDSCSAGAAKQATYSLVEARIVYRTNPGARGVTATFDLVKREHKNEVV